jgi:hypothetical protein
MKIDAFKSALSSAMTNGWNFLVQSAPGCGKSDAVEQVAASLGYDLMILHPVVQTPDDVKGLGFVKADGTAEFIPYDNMKRMLNATRPLIVFLDDLGQASQAMQGALMQLILAREVDGKKLSKHVRFVAATNRRSDNAGVSGIITALISRFNAVVTLDLDANLWIQWGLANGMPAELLAFIKFRPTLLSTFDPKKRDEQFACPRTIANLGKWVNAGVIDLEVWSGAVGEAFATEFYGFHAIYSKVAGLPSQIVLNPTTAPIPDKADMMFALSSALAHMAKPANLDALATYVERIDGEFRTFFWKSATLKNPDLCKSAAYVNWTLKHADDIA